MKVVFEEGGEIVNFEKRELSNYQIIATRIKYNNLYKLKLRIVTSAVVNLASDESLLTWHRRLGHVNFQTLRKMQKEKTVIDLTIKNSEATDPFYEGCVYAKQHRQEFPKQGRRRSQIPGEVFHADLQ